MLNHLSEIGKKMSALFGDSFSKDSEASVQKGISKRDIKKHLEDVFNFDCLSDLLPYNAYDGKTGLFFLDNSVGFTIEMVPTVGYDKTLRDEFLNILHREIDEGDSLQCLMWGDYRIGATLNYWKSVRLDGLYKDLASSRIKHIQKQGIARNFRTIFSYSHPVENVDDISEIVLQELAAKKKRILTILNNVSMAFAWTEGHLLSDLSALVNLDLDRNFDVRDYSPYDLLKHQVKRPSKVKVNSSNISWEREDSSKKTIFKSYRVDKYPKQWSLGLMSNLIGDMYREGYRLNSPFLIQFGVYLPKQSVIKNQTLSKLHIIEHQAKSGSLTKLNPVLKEEAEEASIVRECLGNGELLYKTSMSVGVWAFEDNIIKAENEITSLFRINKFSLEPNTFMHMPVFFNMLPMSWGEYHKELEGLGMFRKRLSCEAVNLLPIGGEWQGTRTPNMLFLGRKGQICNWNPFDGGSNYNLVVAGSSGAGKSVFMQELIVNHLSTGTKVYVIEIGRSFEKLCQLIKGQHLKFSYEDNVCLNPFTKIQDTADEKDTSFELIFRIIATMAVIPEEDEYQKELIMEAITAAWNKRGNSTTLTTVAEYLSEMKAPEAKRVAIILRPYSKEGRYSKYFEGENNIDFNNPFVLTELEELKGKGKLQEVILELMTLTIAGEVFLSKDRRKRFCICIDEAWDLLRTEQCGRFIEELARKVRKYGGSLVVGTQGLADFFEKPRTKAIYDQSEWKCIMAQNNENVETVIREGYLSLDDYNQTLLKSVRKADGKYSEAMIYGGNGNKFVVRLLLDRFSQVLYSTNPEEFAAVNDLVQKGVEITRAVALVAQGGVC